MLSSVPWEGPDADRFRSTWRRDQARRIDAAVDDLREMAAAMESNLRRLREEADVAFWKGPDADRFRQRLQDEHTAAVQATVEAVQRAAADLRRQAAAQQRPRPLRHDVLAEGPRWPLTRAVTAVQDTRPVGPRMIGYTAAVDWVVDWIGGR